jgi:hypothetical protein
MLSILVAAMSFLQANNIRLQGAKVMEELATFDLVAKPCTVQRNYTQSWKL